MTVDEVASSVLNAQATEEEVKLFAAEGDLAGQARPFCSKRKMTSSAWSHQVLKQV